MVDRLISKKTDLEQKTDCSELMLHTGFSGEIPTDTLLRPKQHKAQPMAARHRLRPAQRIFTNKFFAIIFYDRFAGPHNPRFS